MDYYAQLEQGRGIQPSEQMLANLARALRLTADERDYLYYLAGRPVPSSSRTAHVHPGMLDLLDRLPNTPAQIMTDLSEILVQNRLAKALLGNLAPAKGIHPSFVYRWFTDPAARERYHPEEHEHQSQVFVADLRAVVGKRGEEPAVTKFLTSLKSASAEFRDLWMRQEVAVRRSDRKRLVHPVLGVIELNCLNLLSEDGSQRLLWFTAPPGSDAHDQLELLDVVGTQDLDVSFRAEGTLPGMVSGERSECARTGLGLSSKPDGQCGEVDHAPGRTVG